MPYRANIVDSKFKLVRERSTLVCDIVRSTRPPIEHTTRSNTVNSSSSKNKLVCAWGSTYRSAKKHSCCGRQQTSPPRHSETQYETVGCPFRHTMRAVSLIRTPAVRMRLFLTLAGCTGMQNMFATLSQLAPPMRHIENCKPVDRSSTHHNI